MNKYSLSIDLIEHQIPSFLTNSVLIWPFSTYPKEVDIAQVQVECRKILVVVEVSSRAPNIGRVQGSINLKMLDGNMGAGVKAWKVSTAKTGQHWHGLSMRVRSSVVLEIHPTHHGLNAKMFYPR